MGTYSDIHRYREAGDEANVNNVRNFGTPVKSLFTSTKVLTIHHRIEITDGSENVLYRAASKAVSLHDKTDLTDAEGNAVAHIERKIFSIRQRHTVTMADGTSFEVKNELLHLVKKVMNIEELGWQLRGNILALNFELYDREEKIVAVISQKMFSLHDKYCIDLYQPEYEKQAVALLVTLQHMIRDSQNASSSSSSSSSSQ